MSSSSSNQEMGDIFNARRAKAALQRQQQHHQQQDQEQEKKPSSIVDIQKEQAAERTVPTILSRPNNNSNNSRQQRRREQGAVASLLESFGFIQCAERPEQVFFHYSEMIAGDNMKVGQEVEFHIGESSKSRGKLAAYRVRALPAGTVKWEIVEDETRRRGHVVKGVSHINSSNSNSNSNSNNNSEGSISLLDDNSSTLLKYASAHYQPATNSRSSRLAKGDLVEFVVAVERRSGKRVARDITLIQSERERREERLLATAVPDQGVVVSWSSSEGGWLRVTKQGELVRAWSKHVSSDETLEKGQSVECLVCREENSRGPTARNVKVLSEQEVVFSKRLATAVEGVLMELPKQPPSRARKDRSFPTDTLGLPSSGGTPGKLRLKTPLQLDDETLVDHVLIHIDDSPGGVHDNYLWIQVGDTLAMDVVQESYDDSYRAVSVRLVRLSLAGRAQGLITAIKEGFGFVTLAERNVDLYFKLYEVFPDEIQESLGGSSSNQLQVGTPVTLDVSVAPGSGTRKENLKGQRLAITKELTLDLVLTEHAKGVVNNSGMIELDIPVKTMSVERRYPLVDDLLTNMDDELTFVNAQSTAETKVIMNMAESKGMEVTFVGGNGVVSPNPVENGFAKLKITNPGTPSHKIKRHKSKLVKLVRYERGKVNPGDVVSCTVAQSRRTGACTATQVQILERSSSTGIVLMEPSYTSIRKMSTPTKHSEWSVDDHSSNTKNRMEEGVILCITSDSNTTAAARHVKYRSTSLLTRSSPKTGRNHTTTTTSTPRRGDMVSFKGTKQAKDVHLVKSSDAAQKVRGKVTNLNNNEAVFVTEDEKQRWALDLKEIVSCDKEVLEEGTLVEGILHEGAIYGVCRLVDLYLESKVGSHKKKERPRLNLTVKKEGRKRVDQAKGPDGTIGFAPGWTHRSSRYPEKVQEKEEEKEETNVVVLMKKEEVKD